MSLVSHILRVFSTPDEPREMDMREVHVLHEKVRIAEQVTDTMRRTLEERGLYHATTAVHDAVVRRIEDRNR